MLRAVRRDWAVVTVVACALAAVAGCEESVAPAIPPQAPQAPAVPPQATGTPQAPTAGSETTMQPVVASAMAATTYHEDIRPILESHCVTCHQAGGQGAFPLDSYEQARDHGARVVLAVLSRTMPPFLADDTDCTPIVDNQRLTDGQLALFSDWQTGGFAEGDPGRYVPPTPPRRPDLGEPDRIIKARNPFQLVAGGEDYHCMATDAEFAADTWVTAMDLVPEHPEYLHHADVILGRTCTGLGAVNRRIHTYRPGSQTVQFEEGDAVLIPAGSGVFIQFHWDTRFEAQSGTLPTDHSAFRIWTLPSGQRPQRKIAQMPHHDLRLSIPVGAVNHEEGGTTTIAPEYAREGAEIIGVTPHMQVLGTRFRETLNVDGKSLCLVDIPAWDQDWQRHYFFEPDQYIPISEGASLTQECFYSNRPQDQERDAQGNQLAPQFTSFGEDARQELCLGHIWFRYPL